MRRLDAELVTRGLCRSRSDAHDAITAGHVLVDGIPALKPARMVTDQVSIKVVSAEKSYVSRGAFKLLGALDAFGIDLTGEVVLDAGASTGGFTEVALERGAARVIAVDVGYGQLAWSLRSHDQVDVLERTNIRNLEPQDLPVQPTVVVADLSFISLTRVIPALTALVVPSGSMVLMVKPQFEAGKDLASASHGVIRDPVVRADAIKAVAESAKQSGWLIAGIAASPLPGPKGNVEYFLWLTHKEPTSTIPHAENEEQLTEWINRAVAEGPP
ncbi:MAG: TlyA family RNA methyltransferase [Candidatus Nanopelagicales bacterium]|nr:TlyA family RNA methyltransferase [Candidatus Nanopelagicales bacterium]MCF8539875.1 TlyA family RNA methyltransferase [Candidatus Nanopelagicales bacterium]